MDDDLLWDNDDDVPSSDRPPTCHVNCHCHNKLTRRNIDSILSTHGDKHFRGMFHMTYPDFKNLCEIVAPSINRSICSNTTRGWTPNDLETIEVRVACAIRHFSEGQDIDSMQIYGITQLFFNESTELLVAALLENDSPELRNKYKRLFVIAGLNPKSKAQLYRWPLSTNCRHDYCF
jgi:hypothetical protein